MEIEVVLVMGAVAAGLGALLGAPVSFGVLIRTGTRTNYNNLPRWLRIVYSLYDTDLSVSNDKRSCHYPELYTFVPIMIFIGYLFINMLSILGSVTVEDRTVFERSSSTLIFIPSLLFWWAVFTFGIEAWLYYKWIPINRIDDD